MKEAFRDKTRDELTSALNTLGIQAEMSDRGRDEEKVQDTWYQRSLGVIDLPEGPIKWINVLKQDGSRHNPPRWWIVFGIPDDNQVSNSDPVKISTVRRKSFPLFGKVVDVAWKGDDQGTGLTYILSNDHTTKELSKRVGNLEVRSYAEEFQGWALQVDRKLKPTSEDWEAILQVAEHLLSSPRRL